MNRHLIWFRRAVWLGIIGNGLLTVPTIFAPEWTLGVLGLRPTLDPVWTACGGLTILLLSLFYIAGANAPYRYRWNAWCAVFARVPGVLFFLVLYPGPYPLLGLFDGAMFVIQLPLLLLIMAAGPVADTPGQVPPTAPPNPVEHWGQGRGQRWGERWLKRTLWAGIMVNLVIGLPALFWPEQVLDLLGARPTPDPVWAAFSAQIMVLLAIFYIPGALWPDHYRWSAILAVAARLLAALFFLWLWPGFYPVLGWVEAVLFLIQLPFLLMTLCPCRPRQGPSAWRRRA